MKKIHRKPLMREVIREEFGSYNKLALKLGISRQSVYNWSYRGLPLKVAYTIEKLTTGKFKVDNLLNNW